MTVPTYRNNPQALRALVRESQIHRDLYIDPDLFALEQEQFYGHTWNFAGHASQIPTPGDYITLTLAGRPLILLRQADGSVRGFFNRCAHKGAKLLNESCGNTGKFLRCPYHAWSFKTDGALLSMPLKAGYEDTGLASCENGQGLTPIPHLQVYRDFIFIKLKPGGMDLATYFGEALGAIDSMVDRSPTGQLRVAGGVLRNVMNCNWKMYLENINDTVHPVSTHESVVKAAQSVWQDHDPDEPKPMAIEQVLPFGNGYNFFDDMGGQVYPNGHSLLGINFSIHSGYQVPPDYEAALIAAHGEVRTREVLGRSPQNAVLYPSIAVKGSPQTMRVIRPLAVDRTLVEAWSFETVGAPDLLLERAMTYNRLVFSPMSVVAHDDIHLFETIQQGLRSPGNEWVSLHRGFRTDEMTTPSATVSGTNEWLMRNQYRAWLHFMTQNMEAEA